MLSEEFLASLNYQQRLALLEDQSFCDTATINGLNPAEVLELPNFTRAERCSQPVVLTKLNISTGELEDVPIPCGTSNAEYCVSCAEYQQRLRKQQVLDGLTPEGTRSALFTLTAPSFGAVHRASFTAKDAKVIRRMVPSKRAAAKAIIIRRNGKCGCGKYHEYTDVVVGAPRKGYDYAAEVIWSSNLPNLVKSTVKRLRYIAKKTGISLASFAVFAVYERQKRGSLHCHFLITVQGNSDGFEQLVAHLKSDWVSPTSKLGDPLVKYLNSEKAQQRIDEARLSLTKPVIQSIPQAQWKQGVMTPATSFGGVYDIRVLVGQAGKTGDITTTRQAAEYVSKYLTKTQSAFSISNISALPPALAKHYKMLRRVAVSLLGDKAVYEHQIAHATKLKREIAAVYQMSEAGKAAVRKLDAHIQQIRDEGIGGAPEMRNVYSVLDKATLTAGKLLTALGGVEFVEDKQVSLRGLKIRLNKVANNAGFAGSLTAQSNWRSTLQTLKNRVKDWAREHFGVSKDEALSWSVNREEMTAEQMRRSRRH